MPGPLDEEPAGDEPEPLGTEAGYPGIAYPRLS
jgi:hypothetical protein